MRGKAGPRPGPKSRGKTLNAAEAQKEAAEAQAAKAADTTMPMPSENYLINLAKRCKSYKKQAQETSGMIGEMIAKAVENKSLDRKAFSMVRQLDAMSDEKLRVTYHHLMRYIDALGITSRATAQADMFEQDGDEGGEGEGAEGDSSVVPLRGRRGAASAPREVEEAAGA